MYLRTGAYETCKELRRGDGEIPPSPAMEVSPAGNRMDGYVAIAPSYVKCGITRGIFICTYEFLNQLSSSSIRDVVVSVKDFSPEIKGRDEASGRSYFMS